jgi:DNA-binding CsgD family transcriptional regulator
VSARDLRALLSVVEEAEQDDPAGGLVSLGLLAGLARVIGCDDVSYCDLDVPGRRTHADLGLWPAVRAVPDPPEDMFWRHYHSCAVCSYRDLSSDVSSVTMATDFYSAREWRSHPMYADYLRYTALPVEMMLSLPGPCGHSPRILFWRTSGRFTERDRLLAALLRPHIITFCARWDDGPGAGRLTSRQRQLMSLVATGLSNRQAARTLGVAEGTVRKHLENIYERLEVPNRAAAVARAFPDPLP